MLQMVNISSYQMIIKRIVLDINLTSIINVCFRNNNAYIYFTNSFSIL